MTLPAFDAVVHGPTKRFDGGDVEIAVVPRRFQPYVSDGRVGLDEPAEIDHLLYLSGALGRLPDVRRGDVVSVAGGAPAVLDYNFGKYQFIPLPSLAAGNANDSAADVGLAQAAPAGEGDFTLCTFNLRGWGRAATRLRTARYAAEVRRRAGPSPSNLAAARSSACRRRAAPPMPKRWRQPNADFGNAYTATALPGPQAAIPPAADQCRAHDDRVQVCTPRCAGLLAAHHDVPDTGACPVGQYRSSTGRRSSWTWR